MAVTLEQGLNPKRIGVGDHVLVRCTVTAINSSAGAGAVYGGAGDTLSLVVDTPGNTGERQNVTLVVSPIQCQWNGTQYAGH